MAVGNGEASELPNDIPINDDDEVIDEVPVVEEIPAIEVPNAEANIAEHEEKEAEEMREAENAKRLADERRGEQSRKMNAYFDRQQIKQISRFVQDKVEIFMKNEMFAFYISFIAQCFIQLQLRRGPQPHIPVSPGICFFISASFWSVLSIYFPFSAIACQIVISFYYTMIFSCVYLDGDKIAGANMIISYTMILIRIFIIPMKVCNYIYDILEFLLIQCYRVGRVIMYAFISLFYIAMGQYIDWRERAKMKHRVQ